MAEVLRASGPRRVLTAFCDDVRLSRQHMRLAAEEQEPAPTVVGLQWEQAPALTHEIEEIRNALADAALSLWPSWYTTVAQRFDHADAKPSNDDVSPPDVNSVPGPVSLNWLESAWQRCSKKDLPIVEPMATAAQVQQLALALDPSRLVCVLSVASEVASAPRVQALARAAEWLAHQTKAKVIVLVPRSWHADTALDHVTYGAVFYDAAKCEVATSSDAPRPVGSDALAVPSKLDEEAPCDEESDEAATSPQVSVGPICGRPHPKSYVETLVYALLQADAAVTGKFDCNQPLVGVDKRSHLVDLLWREGKLVVELDGPEHHCQSMYIRDRQRDYSLMMKGYTVLRITNAEVHVQQAQAIEKIKNLVRLILSKTRAEGET